MRAFLAVILGVVGAAAAVLSFSALRDLALLCGFTPQLAWLLPVTVDAGAAAGSIVWLGRTVRADARRFARALALGLLALSVAANAAGHGMAAFAVAPAWWVVVIVSAIAPSVLGAVVHLAVLVGRAPAPQDDEVLDVPTADVQDVQGGRDEGPQAVSSPVQPAPDELDSARDVVGAGDELEAPPLMAAPGGLAAPARDVQDEPRPGDSWDELVDRLIAEGYGRLRLADALGISERQARTLIERRRAHTEIVGAGRS